MKNSDMVDNIRDARNIRLSNIEVVCDGPSSVDVLLTSRPDINVFSLKVLDYGGT